MCQAFFKDARFYQFLFRIDEAIATEVQSGGCSHCGGVLHRAGYPRKPRGVGGEFLFTLPPVAGRARGSAFASGKGGVSLVC